MLKYSLWLVVAWLWLSPEQTQAQATNTERRLAHLSQEFLYAIRTEDSVLSVAYADTLSKLHPDSVCFQQPNHQLAFWLNLYNAYTQYLLRQNPSLYQNRNRFFTSKHIQLAGGQLSLDCIEHGIIRGGRAKYGLGYLPKIFRTKRERRWRVRTRDPRVHWALNCGAESCPPILYYQPERLEEQLSTAEAGFLRTDCVYEPEQRLVRVSRIFSWFRGDFGGKKGILRVLERLEIIPKTRRLRLRFKPYVWNLRLDNFVG